MTKPTESKTGAPSSDGWRLNVGPGLATVLAAALTLVGVSLGHVANVIISSEESEQAINVSTIGADAQEKLKRLEIEGQQNLADKKFVADLILKTVGQGSPEEQVRALRAYARINLIGEPYKSALMELDDAELPTVEPPPLANLAKQGPKTQLTTEEKSAILEAAAHAGTDDWVAMALGELGVSEIKGELHNPRILEYHAATSLGATDDETPWNSSFISWVLKEAGYKGTSSASARSWLKWGEAIEEPVPGAVAIFSRPPNPTSGHVGFYLTKDVDAGTITIIAGNSNDAVEIKLIAAERLLDYRLPTGHQANQ